MTDSAILRACWDRDRTPSQISRLIGTGVGYVDQRLAVFLLRGWVVRPERGRYRAVRGAGSRPEPRGEIAPAEPEGPEP